MHEHEGLRHFHEARGAEEVQIPRALRGVIGRAVVAFLTAQGCRVLAVAVGKVHSHFLVELATDLAAVKWVVGQAKRASSRAVKKDMPGSVWAAGGTFKRVLSRGHMGGAYPYILNEQGDDAWTWSFQDADAEGMFGRKRED